MTFYVTVLSSILLAAGIHGQRPFFAGDRSNGYKDRFIPTEANNNQALTTVPGLGSRIDLEGTTKEPIPYDAMNDPAVIDLIENLPVNLQPFWYINRKAIEAHRNTPPRQNTGDAVVPASRIGTGNAQNSNSPQDIANKLGTRYDENNLKHIPLPIVHPEEDKYQIDGLSHTYNANDQASFQLNTNQDQQNNKKKNVRLICTYADD